MFLRFHSHPAPLCSSSLHLSRHKTTTSSGGSNSSILVLCQSVAAGWLGDNGFFSSCFLTQSYFFVKISTLFVLFASGKCGYLNLLLLLLLFILPSFLISSHSAIVDVPFLHFCINLLLPDFLCWLFEIRSRSQSSRSLKTWLIIFVCFKRFGCISSGTQRICVSWLIRQKQPKKNVCRSCTLPAVPRYSETSIFNSSRGKTTSTNIWMSRRAVHSHFRRTKLAALQQ